MKRGNFRVKSKRRSLSSFRKKELRDKSDTQTKINYKNVKEAFEKNLIPDLNNQTLFKNDDGTCPSLLYAAKDNHDYKLMVFLLEQGIDPTIAAPGRKYFFLEILNDRRYGSDIELIKMLVNAGVDINRPGRGKYYKRRVPLVIAIHKGYPVVAEFLIKSGADLEPPCGDPEECTGCNPLQAALEHEETLHLAHLLLDRHVDVNKFCKGNYSTFFLAVSSNNTQLIKRLLDYGVDVNWIYRGFYSITALHSAVGSEKFEAMQLILNHESTDVNTVDPNNVWSVLHEAMFYNSLNCMDSLLNANPDVNLVSAEKLGGKIAVEVNHHTGSNLEVKEKLKRHIVKLRAAGFYLNDRNLAAVSAEKYKSFYAECCQQVDLMKKNTISSRSHVNFHEVLFMTNEKLALCLESLDDQEISHSEFHKKFPLYAGMIEYKLSKGYQWVKLREELHTSIFKLFNTHLPYLIERQIFSYFSINELMELRWKEKQKLF